ncbi:MAG: hypothetical protein V2A73_04220, partial [Pseudomonadota bacterium]
MGRLYGGAGLVGTRIFHQVHESVATGSVDLLGTGSGFSLFAGLQVSDRLSLEAGILTSFHDAQVYVEEVDGVTGDVEATWSPQRLALVGLTADARIHLQRSGSFDPYVQ